MAKVIHKIDPNADTVIILKNPLVHFAVWNYPDVEEPDAEEPARDSEPNIEEPTMAELPTEEGPAEEPAEEPAGTEFSTQEPSVEDPAAEETALEEPVVEPNTSEVSTHEEEIHYHVSSSHLRLVSPKFKSMLSRGNWKEGIPNENDGRYYILAEDWDGEAFLIFLNVLHLRNRQVPRSVSLVMLAKIAVLVDYYNCAEAVELSTEMWVKDLKNTTPIPSKRCRNLMLWMCTAWVLRLPQEFAQTTTVAIKQSKQDELSTLDLPITGFVDSIDQARIEAIGTIISQLHGLLDEYRSTDYCCPSGNYSFECGSILYGALTKEMDSLGLLVPYQVAPFPAMSFSEIYSKVHNVKSPMWSNPGSGRYRSQHSCNLNEKVTEIANSVMYGVNGLKLKDFGRT